ncbi:lysozyme inhibitor LprI family protein [Gemmobacter serpentinus]|uniref:lysozyme inhibitor LprI family protein n=1 Tax=Gemmobacter serpentinus TaxID=2652247 RepID=UPI00124EF506|nr:lysozyme inhibitor LprI family protein [Gemmobacter serpentinus]
MRALVLAALGLMAASAAMAQDVDCANAMAQMEMTYCAEQDWMRADADLNDAYKSAMAAMKAIDAALPQDQRGAEAHLRAAQRAWVTFRDEACAAEGYQMHGGSAEPMVIYGCRATLTRQRAKDLWVLAG